MFTPPQFHERTTEREWQSVVVEAAGYLGWLAIHFPRMQGNPTGWPDLILVGHGRTVYAELKTARGKVSDKQHEWHERLRAHGAEVHVWRPDDWPDVLRVLDKEQAVPCECSPSTRP